MASAQLLAEFCAGACTAAPARHHPACPAGAAASATACAALYAALWRAALRAPAAAPLLRAYLPDVDFAPLAHWPLRAPRLPLAGLAPIRPLGSGLFGRVLLAAPPCAVKQADLRALYGAPGAQGVGQAHRALRELRALRRMAAALPHCGAQGARFLVALRGHCASPCRRWLYLLLELCPGGNLLQRLRQRARTGGGGGGLPLAEARGHLACLLAALRALHGLGIAHRDVRPANLALGSDGLLRLLDFNLCRGGWEGERGEAGGGGSGGGGSGDGDAAGAPALPAQALQRVAALWRPPASGTPGSPPALPSRFHSAPQAAAFAAWCAVTRCGAGAAAGDSPPAAAAAAAARPLQRTYSLVGSPVHLSPEAAARGMSQLQHALAADVWALGVTAFQLATGLNPGTGARAWEGAEGSEAAAGEGEGGGGGGGGGASATAAAPQLQQPLALPPALAAQCPQLQDFIAAACTADPAARPTAEQLCQHPLFACALPQAGCEFWRGPVQWGALLGSGSLPALVAEAEAEAAGEEEAAGAEAAGAAWGSDTFFWGRAGEEDAEGGAGGLPLEEDTLQAAEEYES